LLTHVEELASVALIQLTTRAIHRCPSVDAIVPFLCKIVKHEAVNLLRRPWARQQQQEIALGETVEEAGAIVADAPGAATENLDRLRSHIADWMRL